MIPTLSRVTVVKTTFNAGHHQIAHLLHPKAKILYSANGLYAVEKPVDVLSHPNKAEDAHRSVVNGTYDRKTESFKTTSVGTSGVGTAGNRAVYLINRLDSATSGIILMTTNEEISKTVKKLFALRKVTKVYKAIVFHNEEITADQKNLLWEDTIEVRKIKGSNRAQICSATSPNALHAVTALTITDSKLYSVGRSKKDRSDIMLLELRPKTGYTHQLRYQCALHQMPIVGDRSYGNFKQNRAVVTAAKSVLNINTINSAEVEKVSNTADIDLQAKCIDLALEETKKIIYPGENHDNTSILVDRYQCSPNRMMLHSFSIEFNYEYNNDNHHFKAVSKLPAEFKIILDNSYNNF